MIVKNIFLNVTIVPILSMSNLFNNKIAIYCPPNHLNYDYSVSIAADLNIDLLDKLDPEIADIYNYILFWQQESQSLFLSLSIAKTGSKNYLNNYLNVDYVNNLIAGKKCYKFTYNDALPKAMGLAKLKNQQINILDGTAGFTLDAYALLQLNDGNNNINITLLEQSKILCYLVKDGLDRLSNNRVKLININFIDYLKDLKNMPSRDNFFDIIYLDPMFEKANTTAKPKQNMQLLQDLCGNPNDVNELLAAGLDYFSFYHKNNIKNSFKLILKRNIKQPKLLSKYINYSVSSKQVRYDVYVIN